MADIRKEIHYMEQLWHIIDGNFVHIVQETQGLERRYYTDGKLIAIKELEIRDGDLVVKRS